MATQNTTRGLLLAAAREEFAEHGIAGARVDAIASRAGVNKERIYGYFGSKEKLFDAVVTEAKAEHAQGLGLPDGDLAEYVGRLYDFHRDHPTLRRLMLWEALYYGDRPVPEDDARTRAYEAKAEALANTLGRDADEQTASTLMTLIGMAAWPHTMPQLARFLLPEATDEHRHEVMRTRVVEFAREGLHTA